VNGRRPHRQVGRRSTTLGALLVDKSLVVAEVGELAAALSASGNQPGICNGKRWQQGQ